jgi:hypothetical protein
MPVKKSLVQVVSCACCGVRLTLHFVHGENEVYDVELVGTVDSTPHACVGDQSRCSLCTGKSPLARIACCVCYHS